MKVVIECVFFPDRFVTQRFQSLRDEFDKFSLQRHFTAFCPWESESRERVLGSSYSDSGDIQLDVISQMSSRGVPVAIDVQTTAGFQNRRSILAESSDE